MSLVLDGAGGGAGARNYQLISGSPFTGTDRAAALAALNTWAGQSQANRNEIRNEVGGDNQTSIVELRYGTTSETLRWQGVDQPTSSEYSGDSWIAHTEADFSAVGANNIPAMDTSGNGMNSGLVADPSNQAVLTQGAFRAEVLQFGEKSERIVGWYNTGQALPKGSLVLVAPPPDDTTATMDSAQIATLGDVVSRTDFAVFMVAEDVAAAPSINTPTQARLAWSGAVDNVTLDGADGDKGDDLYIIQTSPGGQLRLSLTESQNGGIAGLLRSDHLGSSRYNVHFDIVRAASTLAFNIAPSYRTTQANQFGSTPEVEVLQPTDRLLVESGAGFAKGYFDASVLNLIDGVNNKRQPPPDSRLSTLSTDIGVTLDSSLTTIQQRTVDIAGFTASASPLDGFERGFVRLHITEQSNSNNVFANFERLYIGDLHEGTDVQNGTDVVVRLSSGLLGIAKMSYTVSGSTYNILFLPPLNWSTQELSLDFQVRSYQSATPSLTEMHNIVLKGGVNTQIYPLIPSFAFGATLLSVNARVQSGQVTIRILKNGSNVHSSTGDITVSSGTIALQDISGSGRTIQAGQRLEVEVVTEPQAAQDLAIGLVTQRSI